MTNKLLNVLCFLVVTATFAIVVIEHGQQPRGGININQTKYKPQN